MADFVVSQNTFVSLAYTDIPLFPLLAVHSSESELDIKL